MHERRVADYRNGIFPARLVEAVKGTHRSTHAERHLHSRQRSYSPESVAAYITQDGTLCAVESVEQPPMRTARTHYGRSWRNFLVEFHARRCRDVEFSGDNVLAQFT